MKNIFVCTTLLMALCLTACDKPVEKQDLTFKDTIEVVGVDDDVAKSPLLVQDNAVKSWRSHVEYFPEGWVSAYEPLKVRFSHPVTGDELILGQPVEGVLTIEPRIEAKISFTTDRALLVEPKQPLDRNVEYQLTLFPNKLSGINRDMKPYQFVVKVYQQDFGVQVDGLKIDAKSEAHTVSGKITTNDADDNTKLEALLSAKQGDKALIVAWNHVSSRDHEFTISGIQRKQNASEVMVSWSGKIIDIDKSGELAILIPALSSFDVLGAVSRFGANKFIEINFSEPLDSNQSFKGLIKVQGQEVNNVRVDGNSLRLYPKTKLSGEITVTIFEGIKSTRNARTQNQFTAQLMMLQENPGVRFKDGATILPEQSQITIPIEAVNVDSVQITAYQMKATNIGQFLQSRNLSSRYVDARTTSPLWRKTYRLPEIPKDKWTRFDLDVTDNFKERNNDLLAFEVKINKSNIILDCGEKRPLTDDSLDEVNQWPFSESQSKPSWVAKYYNSRGHYQWRDRENPCKERFYEYSSNSTKAFRYFHTSNLGLIAKMGVDRAMLIVATDINSGEPLKKVEVVAYNAQHQPVAKGRTNKDGMLNFTPVSAPFYLLAEHNKNLGFLRLPRNEALSTNVFDTGGEQSGSGIKGFFYGERGVWRPGDNIYLTFIVNDKTGQFPKGYPLTLDLFGPKGNKFDSITQANPVNGFYNYKLTTNDDSPTGNWRAVIRYGGQYFSKVIPVETIKPNRLKIELEFPDEELRANNGNAVDVGLFSQWLNGATVNKLKADVEMNVSTLRTKVSGFDNFIFDDPARDLKSKKQKIFEGLLDNEGRTKFSLYPNVKNAPGKLKLHFTTRVFEKSGNFSIQYSSISYMPYDNLVGINVTKGGGWNDSISRDEVHSINFILLNNDGKPIPENDLDLQVYKVGWRWWWDNAGDNISSYVSSRHNNRLVDVDLKTDVNGRASWDLDGKSYDWGRYLIRVCHANGNHCSGKVVYLGWNYNQQKNPSGDTQLILSADKDRYNVDDVAILTIPNVVTDKKDSAKVLLTIESGTKILSQAWVGDDIKDNRLEIVITEDMAPNVYAHITLLQSYDKKDNDSPIRMYGIVPLLVDNEKTILEPVLELPEKVRPNTELIVKVLEKKGKTMTYTLAVVDEGLLGITNYQTPNPRKALFKREALGVLTWDMYSLISKSSRFNISRLLTIGGSDSEGDGDSKRKKRRFPPVVKFLGPFTLKAGSNVEHKILLPDYMGAVRVMLVAGDQSQGVGAYGVAEKTVRVTQPLTVLATLPRVLGPNESFKLPVNVFVNDGSIKHVTITIETNELFVAEQITSDLVFDKTGDQIVSLDVKTINAIGEGRVKVVVQSENEKASQIINIQVRTANLPQVVSKKAVLQPGESKTLRITPNGMLNTNTTYFEISRGPQINLENRMDYLLGYPHGCLEQTTSKLFPQLFLGNLTSLTQKQKDDIEYNVREGMRKYSNFQTVSGDFNYWPGGSYSNQWSNSYAGHFLVEAKKMGYNVPSALYSQWLKAQKNHAKETGNQKGYEGTDAYTLYTLAIAGEADFNAMNRLKEKLASKQSSSSNHRVARWLLASAYAHVGVEDAALELINLGGNLALEYEWSGYTYGSKLRDDALLTMTYNRTQQEEKAWEMAQIVADQLSEQTWYSTHSLAWGLMALADFYDMDSKGNAHPVSWTINQGARQRTQLLSPIFKHILNNTVGDPVEVAIYNEGEKPFYVLLGNKGVPENSKEVAQSRGVTMEVVFEDMDGQRIDVSNIVQGEDFKARVTVSGVDKYSRLENLALSMIAPSGWEISNDRLKGVALSSQLEYQDIRDDRVLSYFTLGNYYWWHRNNSREVTVEITLNASYAGRFYLPGWYVESMYDKKVAANTVGQWVNVVPQQ